MRFIIYRGLERGFEFAEFEQHDVRRDAGHRQFPAFRTERQQLNGKLILVTALRRFGPGLFEHLGSFQFVQHLQTTGAGVPEPHAAVRVPVNHQLHCLTKHGYVWRREFRVIYIVIRGSTTARAIVARRSSNAQKPQFPRKPYINFILYEPVPERKRAFRTRFKTYRLPTAYTTQVLRI